ncbi:LysR family transcriptional regulator [Thaumasiovibrio subtropicus]|uniref:LysR family transcriptional regulator n=1 Tax=Thaumasiovibrio subtropicus TaxID=1891207 RepID=UPI000B355E36|nr:LysR family transcriptional regulator [Thaumasiovibrio subtropicus]
MRTRSDDLAILLTVVDCGSFSAAAEMLDSHVAKVSRAVSKVESQLGVTLLNRTTRRLELTEEGRAFVVTVRTGLAQLLQAEEAVIASGEQPRGKLRIDAASPFILHQIVPHIRAFSTAYPDIDLELTSNEGYVDLLEKRVDVAIRIGPLTDSTLHAKRLGESKLFLVASPTYLDKFGIPDTIGALMQYERIGFTHNKSLNHWPLPGSELIAPTLAASSGETIRQLAIAGNGIACLSGFMVNEDIQSGRLVPVLTSMTLRGTERENVNAVYYRSSSVSRRISAFLDFIQPRLTL